MVYVVQLVNHTGHTVKYKNKGSDRKFDLDANELNYGEPDWVKSSDYFRDQLSEGDDRGIEISINNGTKTFLLADISSCRLTVS